jgi:hypothetical protein
MTKPRLGIGDWGPGPVRRGQGQPFEPGQGRSRNRYSRLPIGRDESGWWMGNMRRRRRIRFVHEKWIRIAARGRPASTRSRRRVRRRLPEGRASRHGNCRRRGHEECGRTRFPDSLLMSVPCKTRQSSFNEISTHRRRNIDKIRGCDYRSVQRHRHGVRAKACSGVRSRSASQPRQGWLF